MTYPTDNAGEAFGPLWQAMTFAIYDPRQASVRNPRMYLAKIEFPALWTPHRENAVVLPLADWDALKAQWPYLNACEFERVVLGSDDVTPGIADKVLS